MHTRYFVLCVAILLITCCVILPGSGLYAQDKKEAEPPWRVFIGEKEVRPAWEAPLSLPSQRGNPGKIVPVTDKVYVFHERCLAAYERKTGRQLWRRIFTGHALYPWFRLHDKKLYIGHLKGVKQQEAQLLCIDPVSGKETAAIVLSRQISKEKLTIIERMKKHGALFLNGGSFPRAPLLWWDIAGDIVVVLRPRTGKKPNILPGAYPWEDEVVGIDLTNGGEKWKVIPERKQEKEHFLHSQMGDIGRYIAPIRLAAAGKSVMALSRSGDTLLTLKLPHGTESQKCRDFMKAEYCFVGPSVWNFEVGTAPHLKDAKCAVITGPFLPCGRLLFGVARRHVDKHRRTFDEFALIRGYSPDTSDSWFPLDSTPIHLPEPLTGFCGPADGKEIFLRLGQTGIAKIDPSFSKSDSNTPIFLDHPKEVGTAIEWLQHYSSRVISRIVPSLKARHEAYSRIQGELLSLEKHLILPLPRYQRDEQSGEFVHYLVRIRKDFGAPDGTIILRKKGKVDGKLIEKALNPGEKPSSKSTTSYKDGTTIEEATYSTATVTRENGKVKSVEFNYSMGCAIAACAAEGGDLFLLMETADGKSRTLLKLRAKDCQNIPLKQKAPREKNRPQVDK